MADFITEKLKIKGSEAIIQQICDSMPGGVFIYKEDGDQEILFSNDRMASIFGCSTKEEFLEYVGNSFKGIVHEDDYDDAQESVSRQAYDASHNMDHVVYRILRKDGAIRWIDDYGRLVSTEDCGDLFFVFINDITESYNRQNEAKILQTTAEEKERAMKNLIDGGVRLTSQNTLDGIKLLLVDDSDITREINKEILEDEGAEVHTAENGLDALTMVKGGEEFDLILMDIVMPVMNGVSATKAIIEYEARNGQAPTPIVALTAAGSDMQVRDVLNAGAYECIYKPLNIQELSRIMLAHSKETSEMMEKILNDTLVKANQDALTGVKNISAYTDKLTELRAELMHNPNYKFGVCFCDCNGLKEINDNQGHNAGDQYLKNCCQIICKVFKKSPVYRIGGDEFVVIMTGEDFSYREVLLAELKEKVKAASEIENVKDGKASIACGLAVYDRFSDPSVANVIKRADKLMYANKNEMKAKIEK